MGWLYKSREFVERKSFLKRDKEPTIAKDLRYNYANAYRTLTVNPISERIGDYNCMFLGNPQDSFHFAIYY